MVDDSPGDRNLYRLQLEERFGSTLEFLSADSAAAGIELCMSAEPDCVLLDYKLPDMSGLEFLNRLGAGDPEDAPRFAVVMLTGLVDEQIAVDAMKAGVQDYLVKDRITSESLVSAIYKATEKVGLMRALKEERDRLATSLAEKEVLLKEVHHRVKNNLQVIASLLRLQADSFSNPGLFEALRQVQDCVEAIAQKLSDTLRESQNRVESMALIHEQLYAAEDLRTVDLAKHVNLLAGNLFHSYGNPARISWSAQVEALQLGLDQAIPVSLILNELVSNALKHGFPDGALGSIRIEGRRENGRTVITVNDDGCGVPAGIDVQHPKSLGLEIIGILTKQLKGTFHLDRTHGTTFLVSCPLTCNL